MNGSMASAAHTIDDHTHSRISPELVLVDPELSRRVRPRVPLRFGRRKSPLPVLRGAPAVASRGEAADRRGAAAP
jgi:hypothetical protein